MAQRRHVWYSPWLLKSQAIVSPVENSSPTVQALYEHGALRASPTFWVSWRPPTDSLARLGATGAFFEKHRQHTTPTQRPSHPGNCCALNFTMLSCWLSFGRFGQTKLLRESSSVFLLSPYYLSPFVRSLFNPSVIFALLQSMVWEHFGSRHPGTVWMKITFQGCEMRLMGCWCIQSFNPNQGRHEVSLEGAWGVIGKGWKRLTFDPNLEKNDGEICHRGKTKGLFWSILFGLQNESLCTFGMILILRDIDWQEGYITCSGYSCKCAMFQLWVRVANDTDVRCPF